MPWLFRKLWIVFPFFPNNEKLKIENESRWIKTFSIMWLRFVFGHHACSSSYPNAGHEMDPSKNCGLPYSIHSKAWQTSRNEIWILHIFLPSRPTPLSQMISILGGIWIFAALGGSRIWPVYEPIITNESINSNWIKQTSIGTHSAKLS